jgi:osmotically-inducible protein OsmY
MAGPRRSGTETGPHGHPPGAERTTIVAEARLRLARSGYAVLGDVRCEFESGVLYLRGHLTSHYLKQVAQATVADFEGAETVVNLIEVDPPGGVAGSDHRLPRRHSLPPGPPLDEE